MPKTVVIQFDLWLIFVIFPRNTVGGTTSFRISNETFLHCSTWWEKNIRLLYETIIRSIPTVGRILMRSDQKLERNWFVFWISTLFFSKTSCLFSSITISFNEFHLQKTFHLYYLEFCSIYGRFDWPSLQENAIFHVFAKFEHFLPSLPPCPQNYYYYYLKAASKNCQS